MLLKLVLLLLVLVLMVVTVAAATNSTIRTEIVTTFTMHLRRTR